MKPGAKKLFSTALALSFFLLTLEARAQLVPVGSGTNLSSVMYCDPPHDQQVKMRLTGAEMSPLPNATYDVKKLEIQQFSASGTLEAVARAPQCLYAPMDGQASSAGHLDLTLGGGKIHLQGEGFLWQQNESRLIISNRVSTVIKMGSWNVPTL